MAAPICNDLTNKLEKIMQVYTEITTKLASLPNVTMQNALGNDSLNMTLCSNNNNNSNAPLMPELLEKQHKMPPAIPSLMSLTITMPMTKKTYPLPTSPTNLKPQKFTASKRAQNLAILAQPVPNFVPHIPIERAQLQSKCSWNMVARRKNPLPDKPPAFFLPMPQNQNALLPILMRDVGTPLTHYHLTRLRNGLTQITADSMDTHAKIKTTLEANKYAYFSHQPRWERGAKFAIINLHHTTPIEAIRKNLKDLGFETKFLKGLTNYKTHRPMNIFTIEITKQNENKHNDILKIKALCCQEIRIERQRGRNMLPQCGNCLLFGHTARYCHLAPLCRICAGSHHASKCTSDGQLPKCGNCGGGHRATYRGCAYFKAELAKFLIDQRPLQRKRQQQHESKKIWLNKSKNNFTHSPENRHLTPAAPCPAPSSPSRPAISSAIPEKTKILKSLTKSPKNLKNLPINPRVPAPASAAPCPSSPLCPQRPQSRPKNPSPASERKNNTKSAIKSTKSSTISPGNPRLSGTAPSANRPTTPRQSPGPSCRSLASAPENKLKSSDKSLKIHANLPANSPQPPVAPASGPSGRLAKAAPENNKKSTKNRANPTKNLSEVQQQPPADPTGAFPVSPATPFGPITRSNRHKTAIVPEKKIQISKYAIKSTTYSPAKRTPPAATRSPTPDAPEKRENPKLISPITIGKSKSQQYLPKTRPSASHGVYSPAPESKNQKKHQRKKYLPANKCPRPNSFTLSSPDISSDESAAMFL